MRRSLASSFVLVAAAVLTVGLAGTASATAALPVDGSCAAVVEPPHLRPGGTRLWSTGRFECLEPATMMEVTVCIEEQNAFTGQWWSYGCTTAGSYELGYSVEATHSIGVPVYATTLRSTVSGKNARGDRVYMASPPTPWFNCACYIG